MRIICNVSKNCTKVRVCKVFSMSGNTLNFDITIRNVEFTDKNPTRIKRPSSSSRLSDLTKWNFQQYYQLWRPAQRKERAKKRQSGSFSVDEITGLCLQIVPSSDGTFETTNVGFRGEIKLESTWSLTTIQVKSSASNENQVQCSLSGIKF